MKSPDNNILEYVLSKKVILVEGDAEFILLEALFEKISGSNISDSDVHIISVGGTSFKRYLDIGKEIGIKTAVIRDNDGDFQHNCVEQFDGYVNDNLKIFYEEDNANTTFEVCIYNENTDLCEELFGAGRRSLSVQEYMLKNKATAAFELLDSKVDQLEVPKYIEEAITWIGFTVNIGIGLNKIQAKMGGELKKPNMVHTLWPEEIEKKLWPLEVGELFMVGRKTEARLKSLSINTIGDLATANIKMLESHLKSYAYLIQAYANGRDDSPVRASNRPVVKGMGNGTTARFNVLTASDAYLHIMSLSESVGGRLRDSNYCAGLVAVSYTTTEFVTKSRQRKLSVAMDSTSYIMKIAKELFDELWTGEPLRKFRVRVTDLYANDYVQLSFLEQFDFERERCMDKAVDEIRDRFGGQAIYRACFLHSGVKSGAGGTGDEDDYPVMTSIL